MAQDNWPKRPDGSNKTMGEMTPAEQRQQFAMAVERLKPEFAKLGVALVNGIASKEGNC